MTRPSVAVLWRRFGPYHLARLRSAQSILGAAGYQVIGLEVAGRDQYAWENPAVCNGALRTLFPAGRYEDLRWSGIRRSVLKALDAMNPAAVAINGWIAPEAIGALHWCRRNGKTAVLMSESMENDKRRRWWTELVKGRMVQRFDAALVGGQPHADYAVKLGMPRNRVFKGYDVVDNGHFAAVASRARSDAQTLRRREGLPEKYLFANCRFIQRKNIATLIRAFALYRKAVSDPWDLVIAGSGREEAAWKRLAEEQGLASCIHWPGFLQYDALPEYYGLASAFVHPALVEPWGLVVNEACACGLPVLVSRTVGAVSELVKDNVNGFLFDPCQTKSIFETLMRFHNLTDDDRRAMGEASKEISGCWDINRFGEGLLAALKCEDSLRKSGDK